MNSTRHVRALACAAALLALCPLRAAGQSGAERPLPLDPNFIPQPAQTTPLPAPQPLGEPPPVAVPEGPTSPPVNPVPSPVAQALGPLAAGPMGMMFNRQVGQMPTFATYKATWFPDVAVQGQNTRLGYQQQDFSFSAPVWQDPCNEWSVSTSVRGEFFHTGAFLPDSGRPFPDELWNVRFGTSYRHLFDNGWIAGAGANVGSASDQPFHSIEEIVVGFNAFVRIPSGERNAWLLSLNYSPNNELNFPIPGVAYVWQPSDCFVANIGLPFMIFYRPTDDLTLDFSYMLIRTVHARATYRLAPELRAHIAFDWASENYYLADRANVNDRFFYYDKKVTAGAQYVFSPHALLDLSGGYVFDRFYFQGAQYSGDNHNDRVDLGSGPFLSLQFQMRW